jgi:hypothetical protein
MWTVLIGENGTAKSTILQAIALAATGSRQVNTLAGPVVRHLRDRRSDAPMSITADFDFTPHSRRLDDVHPVVTSRTARKQLSLRSEVTLQTKSTSLLGRAWYVRSGTADRVAATEADPLDEARDVHRHLWFVAGYGISRALPDPSSTPPLDRPSIDRLAPLFGVQATLASTSFANHFLKKDIEEGRRPGTTSRLYSGMLNEAIKIGGDELLPDIDRLELRGQGGTKSASDIIESDRFSQRMGRQRQMIAGVALSHGYQSTFAWIADLIGHVLLESKTVLSTTEMEGLVLLDEIDSYLHPTWQAKLVTALRRVFPAMQFVVTTHSPIVLAELAPHEVVRLVVDEPSGDIVRAPPAQQPDPRPMTASELYRAWFDLDRLTPNPHGKALRDYLILAGDPLRSKADEALLQRLAKALADAKIDPGRKPVAAARRG